MNAHNTTICVVSLVQNVYYTLKFTTQNQNHWVQTNIFSDNNDCTKLEFNVAASQCHLRQFWGDFVFDSMPGWHKLWQAGKRLARTTELVRTKSLARLSSVGLRPSSVLSPQSSPQKIRKHCIFVAEMPNVFAPKNLIYGILFANVARISTYAF